MNLLGFLVYEIRHALFTEGLQYLTNFFFYLIILVNIWEKEDIIKREEVCYKISIYKIHSYFLQLYFCQHAYGIRNVKKLKVVYSTEKPTTPIEDITEREI